MANYGNKKHDLNIIPGMPRRDMTHRVPQDFGLCKCAKTEYVLLTERANCINSYVIVPKNLPHVWHISHQRKLMLQLLTTSTHAEQFPVQSMCSLFSSKHFSIYITGVLIFIPHNTRLSPM
jgi:hypothetical protein